MIQLITDSLVATGLISLDALDTFTAHIMKTANPILDWEGGGKQICPPSWFF